MQYVRTKIWRKYACCKSLRSSSLIHQNVDLAIVQCKLDFHFFLYCTARQQTFPESQLLEAWPASIYGHLRGYLQRTPYLQEPYLHLTLPNYSPPPHINSVYCTWADNTSALLSTLALNYNTNTIHLCLFPLWENVSNSTKNNVFFLKLVNELTASESLRIRIMRLR